MPLNRCALLGVVTFIFSAAPSSALATGKAETLDAKGVKIHYMIEGKGEPVVLIHGLHSTAQINWGWPGTIALLAKDHLVIALDVRGHGQSDRPMADDAYGVQMVEDVVLLLDHLKMKQAHIVGYSMGGMIAMKLMVDHPDRVISCVLGGMGWLGTGTPQQQFWGRWPAREGGPLATPSACPRSFGELAVTQEQVKAIKIPTMVLVGDRDVVKNLYVKPLQSARPDWPVVEIKEAGHLSCVGKPQFKEQIMAWIDAHAAAPPAAAETTGAVRP